MTYTAQVQRGDRYWLVHVTGPGFDQWTQARDLAEVEPMARDLIANMLAATGQEVNPDSIDLDVAYEGDLFDHVREHRERAEQLRQQEAQARTAAARELRTAVNHLQGAGVSQADVARVLGVSKQRVSQLAKAS